MKDNQYLNKFKRCVLEYTELAGSVVSEVGEDPNAAAAPAPGAPADPMAAGAAPMGAPADPMAGGAAPMGAPADPMAGGAAPMGAPADPMAGGAAPMGAVQPGQDPSQIEDPETAAAEDNKEGGPITPNMNAEGGNNAGAQNGEGMENPDDNSDETEDIKKEQDKATHALEKLSSKFEKVFDKIDSIDSRLTSYDEKIDSLRRDMEKRYPNDEEKLSIRSLKSGPFSETPEDYWKEKEADPDSNYSAEDDNNGADMGKYKITKSDIDNTRDWTSISKSFDDERFGLRGLLGY